MTILVIQLGFCHILDYLARIAVIFALLEIYEKDGANELGLKG